MPKFERDVVNILIDQGWQFVPGTKGNKHKLVPPDQSKRARYVAATPSDVRTRVIWIGQLRRSGAILDDSILDRISKSESRRRLRKALHDADGVEVEVDTKVIPISTIGNRWWAPESEPPPPKIPVRVAPAPSVDDARGTAWTLAQARELLRQGYHVRKVISKTGWGLNHFKDLIDDTGYIRL